MSHRHFLFTLAGAGILALGVCVWRPLAAQSRGKPASKVAALEAAVAAIEAGHATTPIIGEPTAGGDATVTFLARRAGGRVPRIVSDVTGWGEHTDGTFDFTAGRMTRVGRTDWYSLQATVAPRARIEYLIAYGLTDFRVDPYNPRQSAGPELGGLRASEFVMPGYVPPPELADPSASPAGLITEASVESQNLGGACRLIVYTPAGYRDEGDYPVAVFLDLRSGQVSRVLDWLIARRAIEPIVAVFVGPTSRGGDHFTGAPLRTFLTDELPAWLASRFALTRSAGRRAVIGISFGAKDALGAALASTDVFNRLGLLVPGRRIDRADIDAIAERRNRRLRVAILAGRYDYANVPTARSLRQALAAAGHVVDYTEVPEGHSAVTWTHHLGGLLVSLFGPASAGTSPGRTRSSEERQRRF
ncbi:MAG TPA: alpha/beta hydrolase-fold protein [Vicinamibacterales bacterium]|jgi:enterochelin esterase-like enzyme